MTRYDVIVVGAGNAALAAAVSARENGAEWSWYSKKPPARSAAATRTGVKQGNEQIVAAFRNRLKTVAGFGFVPAPLPMQNSRNVIVYYLFFASPKAVAEKIITGIFRKYAPGR
jgi:hypothetical protein